MPPFKTLLIFPHQLFKPHPGLALKPDRVALVEDSLFFGDPIYPAKFHKQKLWLHRATMKRYEQLLLRNGFQVDYVDYQPQRNVLKSYLKTRLISPTDIILVADVHDDILEKRISAYCRLSSTTIQWLKTPMFFNSQEENSLYRKEKRRWFMADFYKFQRRRLGILLEGNQPVGGQWSFDKSNRKKVPQKMMSSIPDMTFPGSDAIDLSARDYVNEHFESNPGRLNRLYYPTSHEKASQWLMRFLRERLQKFGDYEDAMVKEESWLWHGVLTPAMNIGLLTPNQVIQAALQHCHQHEIPLNSIEGFVRQIIGWREFMRATYCDLGRDMRTSNHWEHHRPIPEVFYNANTGILPIDDVIGRLLETGYCHHIERLMVLGGFMFLCEIHPNAIYRWFMEMFVDSYDWVMVPNVYGMSQHADAGSIATKPYFSGSSYIRKMSNYPTGQWAQIWDGLYWRWVWNHADDLRKNPRWAMMCAMVRKMDPVKREAHLRIADAYLDGLKTK